MTTNQTIKKETKTPRKTPTPKTELKTIEIPTDGISSGKQNILNFTFSKKRILTPFFTDLIGNEYYGYDHHINGTRLDELGKKFEKDGIELFSYENTPEKYKGLTTQSHTDLMKYNLYQLIEKGLLSITHNDTNYKMIWRGNGIEKPELKIKTPTQKKEKNKPTESELQGLDFTNLFN